MSSVEIEGRTERGFTIIELLIAVSVAGIASILIATTFVFTYGSLMVAQAKVEMTNESQLFLRRMTEDIRLSNEVRSTNALADAYEPGGGWVTSDPANILIVTQPVTDATDTLIYEEATGYPYQDEIVYFGNSNIMYRRLLANTAAVGNKSTTTCPAGTSGCPPDTQLANNLENLLFEFYDIDNNVTTVPEEARSIEITVNLQRQVYGRNLQTSNTSRVTLRNEN